MLRGSVATEYEQGHWRQHSIARLGKARLLKPLFEDRFVREEITIEPYDQATLFAVFPIGRINGTDDVRIQYDELGGELSAARMEAAADIRL